MIFLLDLVGFRQGLVEAALTERFADGEVNVLVVFDNGVFDFPPCHEDRNGLWMLLFDLFNNIKTRHPRHRPIGNHNIEFFGRHGLAATLRTLRHGCHKYGYNCWGDDELYDLEKDPWETRNLINHPDYREIAADLRERLFVWMEQTNDPARRLFQNRLRCYGEHLKLQSHKDRVGQHPG